MRGLRRSVREAKRESRGEQRLTPVMVHLHTGPIRLLARTPAASKLASLVLSPRSSHKPPSSGRGCFARHCERAARRCRRCRVGRAPTARPSRGPAQPLSRAKGEPPGSRSSRVVGVELHMHPDDGVCSIGYDQLIAVLLLHQQRGHAVQPAPGLWNGRDPAALGLRGLRRSVREAKRESRGEQGLTPVMVHLHTGPIRLRARAPAASKLASLVLSPRSSHKPPSSRHRCFATHCERAARRCRRCRVGRNPQLSAGLCPSDRETDGSRPLR